MSWSYMTASEPKHSLGCQGRGAEQAGHCWRGLVSLLSPQVLEGCRMTMRDMSCHKAMVGTCPCHLRPPIWPNQIISCFEITTKDLANPKLSSRLRVCTLPFIPCSSPSSQRLPADPLPCRGPVRWYSISHLSAAHSVAAVPFSECLTAACRTSFLA